MSSITDHGTLSQSELTTLYVTRLEADYQASMAPGSFVRPLVRTDGFTCEIVHPMPEDWESRPEWVEAVYCQNLARGIVAREARASVQGPAPGEVAFEITEVITYQVFATDEQAATEKFLSTEEDQFAAFGGAVQERDVVEVEQ